LPLIEVCDDWYAARGATTGETGWARSCSRERWLGERVVRKEAGETNKRG
jgi:hypothetical protein